MVFTIDAVNPKMLVHMTRPRMILTRSCSVKLRMMLIGNNRRSRSCVALITIAFMSIRRGICDHEHLTSHQVACYYLNLRRPAVTVDVHIPQSRYGLALKEDEKDGDNVRNGLSPDYTPDGPIPSSAGNAKLEKKYGKRDPGERGTGDTEWFGQKLVLHGVQLLLGSEILHMASNAPSDSHSQN